MKGQRVHGLMTSCENWRAVRFYNAATKKQKTKENGTVLHGMRELLDEVNPALG